MSESTSPEFQRIVSARTLFQPKLLPALAAGLLSSLLLVLALVCISAVAWLLIEAQNRNPPGQDSGLSPLLEQWQSAAVGSRFATALQSLRWLQSSGSAAALMLTIAALALIGRWSLRSLAESWLERHVAKSILRLRQHIHRKSIRLEPADVTGEQTRSADRLFQDSTRMLESVATRWGKLGLTVIPDLIVVTVTALAADWRIALQTLVPVVLGRMALRFEGQRGDSSLRLLTDQVERGLGRIAESLKKTRIVTSFGMEQAEQHQFERHLQSYRDRCRQLQQQQALGRGIRNVILLALILIPVGLLVAHGLRTDHPALAVLISGCLIILYRGLEHLDGVRGMTREGSERADEIAGYINRVPSVSQVPGAGFLEPMSKTLTFNQISWQTTQLPGLIRGLDLRIAFGERVALLSLQPTPAFALASMIPRFIDPDLGQVLIDGRDIRQSTLESLRAEAIFVGGQDPVFNASVLENITCGQTDITRQQAHEAAKLVHADHFIRTLPKSYETLLGEHGAALDPGQSFRLSLARAIVREPALLVIEEPTVPLDAETKAMLDDAYQRIASDRTLIFLPSRLSTVKKCTRIVLIHDGKVAVDGVHEQLVRSNELYRHWEYIRFNPYREEAE